jgi:uncharacterized phiE125 gp8 family phage protein
MAVTYQTPEPWGHAVGTAPGSEPVSTADIKAQLRIDHTNEDTYLDSLVSAARENIENIVKRKFIQQTITLTCDDFPAGNWELPFPPIVAVTQVAYRDSAGDSQTLTVPTLRNANNPNMSQVLEEPSTGWPAVDDEAGAVTLTITAGYGTTATNVPGGIRLAIKQLAAHWYNYREAASEEAPEMIPMHIESLLTQHRWWSQ